MKNFRRFKHRRALTLVLASVVCYSSIRAAIAADSAPIRVNNSLPIMLGSGLSVPRDADIASEQAFTWVFDTALQSHANEAASFNSSERLLIDAESLMVNAELRWHFVPRWQAAIKVGGVRHSSGALDSIVRRWHDAFGLTQGDRDRFADDQFAILYASDEQTNFLGQASSGLSDTELSLAHQVYTSSEWQITGHAFINLPTGDANKLSGSESADVGFTLAAASNSDKKLGWHANLGMVKTGDDYLFGIPTADQFWTISAGAHWQSNDRWRWSAQVDGHDAVFESEIEEINRAAWQLSLGLEFASQWRFYFAEDLTVNRAADFSFGLNWRSKF